MHVDTLQSSSLFGLKLAVLYTNSTVYFNMEWSKETFQIPSKYYITSCDFYRKNVAFSLKSATFENDKQDQRSPKRTLNTGS